MRPEHWMFFAAAALQKTANGDFSDKNHDAAAKEAGLYADAMFKEFEDRFIKKEEKFEFPDSPVFDRGEPAPGFSPAAATEPPPFESGQVGSDPSAPAHGDDAESLLAGSGSHKYPEPGVTDWTDQGKPDFEKPAEKKEKKHK